jgi:hypothetical protein
MKRPCDSDGSGVNHSVWKMPEQENSMATLSPSLVQVSEPAILLKIDVLYRPEMSDEELYDTTRGVWKAAPPRRNQVRFALAVVGGIVKEVYAVESWHHANTTLYRSGRADVGLPEYARRCEFTGSVAAPAI